VPVVLGAQGVDLASAISALDAEQRDLTAKQSACEKVIKAACPSITDFQAFADAAVPYDIDERIVSSERALTLANNAVAVTQRRQLTEITLRTLDGFEALAKKSVADISEHAASMVQSHIDTHAMTPNGGKWIKYGVEHMQNNACPFCTQDTSDVPLVSVFKGYFSEQYAALAADVEAAYAELRAVVGENGNGLTAILDAHAADFMFWKDVCDLGTVPQMSVEEKAAVDTALSALVDLFDGKSKNPLATQAMSSELRTEVEHGLGLLMTYLGAVAVAKQAIQSARDEAVGAEVQKAKDALDKRRVLKSKLASPVKDEVETWLKCAKRRAAIDGEKKSAQAALRGHVTSTVGARQNEINALLEVFGAEFWICDTKASFVGREPNADYSIEIGTHRVNAGERAEDKPSFNTILSAGDKFTLALAFFIAQVRADPQLKDATIIFDDPFSSQDMQRQWETTSQLRSLSKDCCQVIVLSHDPRFLALIEKNAIKADCSSFQIMCDDTGAGSISTWSSEKELETAYVRNAQVIREFASKGQYLDGENADSVIKILRPFSEDFVRARFPARFAPLIMLDGMTDEIEAAGVDDPLFQHVARFRAVNEYSRDHMHAGAPPIDPVQLRAQCKRIVGFLGQY
jgi:wobble nucleotide-excising tRNase